MEFATKKDLIKRYAQKRKALDEEDVEDLLNCFISYVQNKIERLNYKDSFCLTVDGLGDFFEYEFDPRNLVRDYVTKEERRKAETMLHEYILTGRVIPLKIPIRDDKDFRT